MYYQVGYLIPDHILETSCCSCLQALLDQTHNQKLPAFPVLCLLAQIAVGMRLIALVVVVPVVVFVERMRVQVGCTLVAVVAQHYVAYVKVSLLLCQLLGYCGIGDFCSDKL
jgi:hypothetical protein